AVARGRPDEIAATILRNAWPLYSAHYELMTRALVALPSSALEKSPILRVMHPMTPVLARTTRPFRPLVTADDARTLNPDELDLITLVQMMASRMSGDESAALTYARRLEER